MRLTTFILIILLTSCGEDKSPDLIITNGVLWSATPLEDGSNTLAIRNGSIQAIGGTELLKEADTETRIIDAEGKFVMPGWIEGHGHFIGLGKSMQNLNFLNSSNWDEIVSLVKVKVKDTPEGVWIEGRGWHQEKWDHSPSNLYHGYPSHKDMSSISEKNPIILYHASGHALFANKKAMDIAGITRETADPSGGVILRDDNGDAIGIFEENAMNLVYDTYMEYVDELPSDSKDKLWYESVKLATEECLSKGITSFQDAGSKMYEIERFTEMANNERLDIRLWAMVRQSADEMKGHLGRLKVTEAGNGYFTCNAIKSEIDGALGAYGAWLLKPYNDKPKHHGQNTTEILEVKKIAQMALKHEMQLCVHAIGDKANRITVDLYEHILGLVDNGNERRWRIEHAQHLAPVDIPRFHDIGIIASMQGIHCTSDAPFVVSRLGEQRSLEGAYAWRSLLDAGVLVANGTDAPVEDVNPIPSFYASVTRKSADGKNSFFEEQCMTRSEALTSYTLSNAYASFEDEVKGSLSVGKYADITIMDTNLLSCPDSVILDTKVLYTIVGGEVKYQQMAN